MGQVAAKEVAGEERPLLGILLKMASVTAFVSMQAMIKAAGQLPPGQIVFFRSAFAIVPILLWLILRGQMKGVLHTARLRSHILRGLFGVTSMGLGFFGLTRLPLPDAVTLNYASPLVVVIFSAIFIGETVRLYRWTAVIVGLIGVIIISWPKLTLLTAPGGMANDEALGVIAILCAAVMTAGAMIQVRGLVKTERTPTIVLYFSLTASVVGLATWVFGWADLSRFQVIALVSAGFCGGIGQILMTQSYRHAEMSTIAPFEYTSLILAGVIGYVAFADVPTAWTLVGGAIVVGSGLFIIWREHRLGLERRAARRFQPPQ
ncbi:EamA family transporter [Zhengella mangrovi]|uniref:EamA family transporter n=1 Tax=Zhengella mangrovi TaxID=1982044 RepID=A0A2G1QS60_9HYPH|nr:DMT family transporter [Zhengella mangrovi]PHP68332.1 EamA family transporter [Zhengella mangrovi]